MNATDLDYRALPVSERLQLVADIWDSIAQDTPLALSPDDTAELHRRLAQHRAAPGSGVPWEKVRHSLFAQRS